MTYHRSLNTDVEAHGMSKIVKKVPVFDCFMCRVCHIQSTFSQSGVFFLFLQIKV